MSYEVLFNGCSGTNWGRMLFAPQPTLAVPPQRDPRSHADQVRAVKAQFPDWFTNAEIVRATGLPNDSVSTALANLRRQGELQKERKSVMSGRISGVIRQRYKWVTR